MRYHLFYAVVVPGNDAGTPERISERIISFSTKKVTTDERAIKKANEFKKYETIACNSLGRKFVAGDLVRMDKGKMTILLKGDDVGTEAQVERVVETGKVPNFIEEGPPPNF